jgi:hypothetical protein
MGKTPDFYLGYRRKPSGLKQLRERLASWWYCTGIVEGG